MRRRTKGRAIRSTPIFWQCTGHRHWGGEDASNRGIPWWGGDGRWWRPYRNHRRIARSNETARRVARRPRRRCPSSSCRAFLCCMALLLSKIHKVSGWTVNAIWQMQPNCNFGSYLSRRLRPQWLLAVVYVILLFHISCPFLRDTLFKSCTRNFKRISGFWILDFRLLSASFWLVHVYTRVQLDIGMCLVSLCTKKNVTWIGNDNWWCANLKIKS